MGVRFWVAARFAAVGLCFSILCGCGYLPGFSVAEQPMLYYLPVSEVATQVSCELQELGSYADYESHFTMQFHDQTPQWYLKNGPVEVTLTIQTDHNGYINLTGVDLARAGFEHLAQYITTTTTAGVAVPTLAFKLTPKRTATATIKFTVSPSSPCPDWASHPDHNLFLKSWLTSYFDKINSTMPPTDETSKKSAGAADKNNRRESDKAKPAAGATQGKSGANCDSSDKAFDGDRYAIYGTPCFPQNTKMESVDLKTQFTIAAEISAGVTPALLGEGSIFLLPVNGVGADFNPDYADTIEVALQICEPQKGNCSSPTNSEKTNQITHLNILQCQTYAVLSPLLGSTVKAPPIFVPGGKDHRQFACSEACGCYVDAALKARNPQACVYGRPATRHSCVAPPKPLQPEVHAPVQASPAYSPAAPPG